MSPIGSRNSEWIVCPSTLSAATPVGAHTAICFDVFHARCCSSVDLPVPARPVTNTCSRVSSMSRNSASCSGRERRCVHRFMLTSGCRDPGRAASSGGQMVRMSGSASVIRRFPGAVPRLGSWTRGRWTRRRDARARRPRADAPTPVRHPRRRPPPRARSDPARDRRRAADRGAVGAGRRGDLPRVLQPHRVRRAVPRHARAMVAPPMPSPCPASRSTPPSSRPRGFRRRHPMRCCAATRWPR